MTKILLNCSTLMKGGALQVASSVIEEAVMDKTITWYFVVTHTLFRRFENFLSDALKERRVILLEESPARNRDMRKLLKQQVQDHYIDVVFTLFGPAYISFPVPHLCGIADGWVTHSNKAAYSSLKTLKEKIRTYLLCKYKLWWYQRADQWCVEALVAKNGFLAKTRIRPESIFLIPNAVNQCIEQYSKIKISRLLQEDSIDVFCLGADYWHKNYQIIPDILVLLSRKLDRKITFLLTLQGNSPVYSDLMAKAKKMGVEQNIINMGPLTLDEVVEAYKKYNILFFPSVLETFSITPLEALYMNMPMIISDIQANRQVVGNYANYVEPLNSEKIATKFIHIISNYAAEVDRLLQLKDENYFDTISSAAKRYATYKTILESMIAHK